MAEERQAQEVFAREVCEEQLRKRMEDRKEEVASRLATLEAERQELQYIRRDWAKDRLKSLTDRVNSEKQKEEKCAGGDADRLETSSKRREELLGTCSLVPKSARRRCDMYRDRLVAHCSIRATSRLNLTHPLPEAEKREPCECELCLLPADDAFEVEFRRVFRQVHQELGLAVHWTQVPFKDAHHWHSDELLGKRPTFKPGKHAGVHSAFLQGSIEQKREPSCVDFSQRLHATITAVEARLTQVARTNASKGKQRAVRSKAGLLEDLRQYSQTNPTLALQLAEDCLLEDLQKRVKARPANHCTAVQLAASLRDYWQLFEKKREQLGETVKEALERFEDVLESLLPREEELPRKVSELLLFLEHGGEFLLKGNCPSPHPLATSFVPDDWQAMVLDCIQEGHSVVVSAPTTAGKSFASLFVVNHVIDSAFRTRKPRSAKKVPISAKKLKKKEDKEAAERKSRAKKEATRLHKSSVYPSRVVFVAPTTALVTQQEADLRREFDAKKKADGNRVTVGACTFRYRHDTESCDVLVCTPAMLEILLMSPGNQEWRERLQWVIFDEVQEIASDEEGSKSLRRAISMIDCNILALSATLSNPGGLRDYLEQTMGRAIRLVPEIDSGSPGLQRWVTLEYGRIVPQGGGGEVVPIHPYGLLTSCTGSEFKDLLRNLASVELSPLQLGATIRWAAQAWPQEMAVILRMEADRLTRHGCESIQSKATVRLDNLMMTTVADLAVLRHQIVALLQEVNAQPGDFQALAPAEDDLSLSLKGWSKKVEDGDAQTFVPALCEEQRENEEKDENEEEEEEEEREESSEGGLRDGVEDIDADETASVVLQAAVALKQQDRLPALFFSDDTELIEDVFERVVLQLQESSDDANVPCIQQSDVDWAEDKEDKGGKRYRNHAKIKWNSLFNRIRENVWPVDLNFCFRGAGTSQDINDIKDLKWWLKQLYHKVTNRSFKVMVDGLARGVAFHHRGISAKYRQVVEFLIREGVVTVCICSRSLALGINLQIRTVVLLDGDFFMTPGSFAQQAGRAGRRYVDSHGLVVPLALDARRLARLLIQPPNDLHITPEFTAFDVLRLYILQDSTRGLPTATNVGNFIETVTKRWLMPSGGVTGESLSAQRLVGHELLFRLRLIDSNCRPFGLAGMVAHCQEAGSGILALAFILLTGKLDAVMSLDLAASLVALLLAPRSFSTTLPPIEDTEQIRRLGSAYNRLVLATASDVSVSASVKETAILQYYLRGRLAEHSSWLYHFLVTKCPSGDQAFTTVLRGTAVSDSGLYASLREVDLLLRKVATSVCRCMGNHHPVAKEILHLSRRCTTRFKEVKSA